MNITVNPKKTVRSIGVAIIALMVLHAVACLPLIFMDRSYPLGLLSMDGEQNLPTAFAVMLLWTTSLLAGVIAWAVKSDGWKRALPWYGLSLAFLLMGFDEFMGLHERFTEPVRNLMEGYNPFRFAWVIPYALFAMVFGLLYLRFFLRLPTRTRKYVLLGTILYIAGCIGLEIAGGAWMDTHSKNAFYYLLVMVEESLEMAGCTVFIYAFLNHMDEHIPGLTLRISSS